MLVVLGFLGISYLYFAVKALTVKEAGWMVPEARWWLPGLPALAWLAAVGYARWWSPPRRRRACLVAAAVPPLIAYSLLLLHLPALYPTAARVEAPAGSLGIVYDGVLELAAAEAGPMTAGQPAEIVLTWRAVADIDADYTLSTQVLVPAADGRRKLAEHNSFPGQGLTPTRGLRAGDTFRDRLTLIPQGDLNGPTEVVVQVTAHAAGETAPATAGGAPIDAPLVASAVIRPAAPPAVPAPLAEPVAFGDAIRLVGAQLEPTAGGPALTLWWEATGQPAADFTVFAHLLEATGALVDQADGPPNDGLSPTRLWRAGDVIRDRRLLPADSAARLLIGLYDPATGERLPAAQGGRPLPDDAYAIPLVP